MRVRLTKKLADALNGIDLTQSRVGDVLDVPPYEAELLVAEVWAEAVPDDPAGDRSRDLAEPPPRRRSTDALQEIRLAMEEQSQIVREYRRLEDRLREELHDARAKTIPGRTRLKH